MRRTLLHLLMLGTLILQGVGQGQEIVRQFEAPGSASRGLAWDGQYLWCADANAERVYQLDPQNGHTIASFDFSMDFQHGGLAWSPDGYLWLTDYERGTSRFYKVDPSSASVVSSFHCPGG